MMIRVPMVRVTGDQSHHSTSRLVCAPGGAGAARGARGGRAAHAEAGVAPGAARGRPLRGPRPQRGVQTLSANADLQQTLGALRGARGGRKWACVVAREKHWWACVLRRGTRCWQWQGSASAVHAVPHPREPRQVQPRVGLPSHGHESLAGHPGQAWVGDGGLHGGRHAEVTATGGIAPADGRGCEAVRAGR